MRKCCCAVGLLLCSLPAFASFHLMQIEQVIGGVGGNTAAQAIQLRMRSGAQNLMSFSRVRVVDAAGANPVLIIDMTTNVANAALGDRVLITTTAFNQYTVPTCVPNFTMTNPIPPAYLAAGSLLFEGDDGTIYWRLSWGGAAYTGSNTGSVTNDANGNFGPPFAGPLPSTSAAALRFNGAAGALSTTNAADYSLTSGAAVFTNNARTAFTITTGACCMANGACAEFQPQSTCQAAGGTYQGNGSLCSGVTCPGPTGACCAANGSCSPASADDCAAAGGEFQGVGSLCEPSPCPTVPTGACCTPDGDCHVDPADDCTGHGGVYGGDGSTCLTVTCVCMRGDSNCDGSVNNFDIDPWVAALLSDEPAYLATGASANCWSQRSCWGDSNCDHAFNNFDIDPFVACILNPPGSGAPCICPGF